MENKDLKQRTKEFSLEIVKFYRTLSQKTDEQIMGKQLFRCGTSVGANTRSAFPGRSKKEFYAKIGIVVEEADERLYWIDLLSESGIVKPERLTNLKKEADELVSIFVSIYHKSYS